MQKGCKVLGLSFFISKNILSITFILFSFIIFFLDGCGIYTIGGVLNPPFDLSISSTLLIFSGYNPEEYFSGYVIWYKKDQSDSYKICEYRGKQYLPTILKLEVMLSEYGAGWVKYYDYSDDPQNPRIKYEVLMENLKPQDSTKNFVELRDEGISYYFAVSSYGENHEESEKVEFGLWQ